MYHTGKKNSLNGNNELLFARKDPFRTLVIQLQIVVVSLIPEKPKITTWKVK